MLYQNLFSIIFLKGQNSNGVLSLAKFIFYYFFKWQNSNNSLAKFILYYFFLNDRIQMGLSLAKFIFYYFFKSQNSNGVILSKIYFLLLHFQLLLHSVGVQIMSAVIERTLRLLKNPLVFFRAEITSKNVISL